jgi:MurNAc alpha-1-phosphate uridylyltransferase
MLFAAGFGTRMGPLTKDRPKPLVRVAGGALLDHALAEVDSHDLGPIVVNCHHFPDQIASHLRGRSDITLIRESDVILETGGGLKNALPILGDGPVFTMNTDAVWHGPNPVQALLAAWDPDKMDALLLCVPKTNAIGHTGMGDFILDETQRITYGPGDVYTGLQIIRTDRLHEIKATSFSIKLLWEKLLQAERMYGLQYSGMWCDVGTPAGVKLAEDMLEKADV